MFSSSFTMSEQQHRQWTPYKHDAPALRAAALCHVLPPAPLAHLEICARPSCPVREGRAEKNCAVMKTKRSTPCPTTGSGLNKTNGGYGYGNQQGDRDRQSGS